MGVLCSFSGIYEENPVFAQGEKVLRLGDIPGTNGYCSEEAQEEIRRRIAPFLAESVHLLDNGNYHYMSRLWLMEKKEPFELAVFDHHTDMQPSALLPILSCGNWVLECLQDSNLPLKKLWLIGPPAADFARAKRDARIEFVSEEEANHPEAFEERIRESGSGIEGNLPLYLSVDRDVLREEELKTTWEQGSMGEEALLTWLRFFAKHREICGLDICGEPPAEEEGEAQRSLQLHRRIIEACGYKDEM